MSEHTLPRAEIRRDLRASDGRERQLWLLTLGMLVAFSAVALAAFFVLGDPLLGGLAVLTVLFCAHVLYARERVARVKLFLNEMSGMAAGSLEVEEYLTAIARGMTRTHDAAMTRILVLRSTDPAVEVVATHTADGAAAEPPNGYSHAVDDLKILGRAVKTLEPVALETGDLDALPTGTVERSLLDGGNRQVQASLVVPFRTPAKTTGLVVLGLRKPGWRRSLLRDEAARAATLARHAGVMIEDAIRRREAFRDPLTALHNRRGFDERVERELALAAREGHGLGVLLCDLDRFHRINANHGHQVGDDVLRSVASVVRGATRGTDLHFRWTGDQFVVVLPTASGDGALVAAERIRQGIRSYGEAAALDLDISIGVALYPQHGRSSPDLVRAADLAMYVAKKSGEKVRIGFEEYDLDEESVRFVYQPIVDADSRRVVGHEVFTRDPEEDRGPLELFRRCRAVGQLDRLKRLIFKLQIEHAHEVGVRRLFIKADAEFLQRTDPVPIPREFDVVVEVSELDPVSSAEDRVATFRKWRRAGYRLAIDDYGAGCSSLPFLEELAPDYVKVPRATLVSAAHSTRHGEFLRHLVAAAGTFAREGIIGEGIELDAELKLARDLGMSLVQGFLLGRPESLPVVTVPVADIAAG